MVAFRQLNAFRLDQLKLAVFDDADITTTSHLVKSQIIDPMPVSVQQIHLSSVKLREDDERIEFQILVNDSEYPRHNDDYFMKVQSYDMKFTAINAICKKFSKKTRHQMLIFFTVSANRIHNLNVTIIDSLNIILFYLNACYLDERSGANIFAQIEKKWSFCCHGYRRIIYRRETTNFQQIFAK